MNSYVYLRCLFDSQLFSVYLHKIIELFAFVHSFLQGIISYCDRNWKFSIWNPIFQSKKIKAWNLNNTVVIQCFSISDCGYGKFFKTRIL